MRIALPSRWKLLHGQSVSVNGICTTVIASNKTSFDVEYMPETLRKTTARSWKAGALVNVERSLKFGDRVDGQFLSGHVEGTAMVTKVTPEGASTLLELSLTRALAVRTSLHGWVALDGVSLTVARKTASRVTVALIPYTLRHTNLHERTIGDRVNIETDRARVSAHASPARRRTAKKRVAPARRNRGR